MDQPTLYEQFLSFTRDKLLYYESRNVLQSLTKLINIIKQEHKLTICAHCKTYKNAGAQCINTRCSKFMINVKCTNCERSFVKVGNHKCIKKIYTSDILEQHKNPSDESDPNYVVNESDDYILDVLRK